MKKCPWVFWLMSALFFAVGLSLPLQVLARFGWVDVATLLGRLSLMNFVVIATCLALGVSAYQGSDRLKLFAPLGIAVVGLNNYFVGRSGVDVSSWASGLGTCAFAGIFALCWHPAARAVLADQSKRWWRVEHRYGLRVPVFLNGLSPDIRGIRIYGQSANVSRSGMLISFSPHLQAVQRNQLPDLGSIVGLSLSVSPLLSYQIQARVVRNTRVTDENGARTQALGLQFIDLSAERWGQIRDWIEDSALAEGRFDSDADM